MTNFETQRVCVCVCVCKRERERERMRQTSVKMFQSLAAAQIRNIIKHSLKEGQAARPDWAIFKSSWQHILLQK